MAAWNSPTMTAPDAPSPYVASAKTIFSATYAAWKAFDGNAATWWNCIVSGPSADQWIKLDCGVGSSVIATACTIKNYYNAGLNAFKVQGSDNDADWIDLYSGNCANNSNVQPFYFAENTTIYRYLRIYCVSGYSATNLAIYEITFSGTEGGAGGLSIPVAMHHYKMMRG